MPFLQNLFENNFKKTKITQIYYLDNVTLLAKLLGNFDIQRTLQHPENPAHKAIIPPLSRIIH